jgi:hypothetical protein
MGNGKIFNYFTTIFTNDGQSIFKVDDTPVKFKMLINYGKTFSWSDINRSGTASLRIAKMTEGIINNPDNAIILGTQTFKNAKSVDFQYSGNVAIDLTDKGYYLMFVNVSFDSNITNFHEELTVFNGNIGYEVIDATEYNSYFKLRIPVKEQLVATESLDSAQILHHNLHGDCAMSYNSRLFLGNTSTLLFKGNSWSDLFDIETNNKSVRVFWYLNTEDGERIVQSYIGTKGYDSNAQTLLVPTMLSYPDVRAHKVRIYVDNGARYKEWKTKVSKNLNLAYVFFFSFSDTINPDEKLYPTTKDYEDYSILTLTMRHPTGFSRNFHRTVRRLSDAFLSVA